MILFRLLLLFLALLVASAQTQRLAVFYDPSVRQAEFAASEIAKAVPGAAPNFAFDQYSNASCSPCVIIASSPAQTARLAADLQVTELRSKQPQSYAIRRVTRQGRDLIAVLAIDSSGAMYGGRELGAIGGTFLEPCPKLKSILAITARRWDYLSLTRCPRLI